MVLTGKSFNSYLNRNYSKLNHARQDEQFDWICLSSNRRLSCLILDINESDSTLISVQIKLTGENCRLIDTLSGVNLR